MSNPFGHADRDRRCIRVAVIDDNPLVLELMREMLERNGREVVTFRVPGAALRPVSSGEFDVVLCDIRMPGMNGMEFYRRLRSDGPVCDDRVVFLTGDRFEPETQRFLAETGCRCLSKPFCRADLERTVSEIVSRNDADVKQDDERQARRKAA